MKYFKFFIANNNILAAMIPMFVLTGFLLVVQPTKAAEVYTTLDTKQISVGDTAIANILLQTDGANINVVEGSILISGNAGKIKIKEMSVAGSDLSYWPTTPSLSIDSGKISFVGGVPGGLNKKTAYILKLVFTAEMPGNITITPVDFAAYLNDGSGTKVAVSGQSVNIDIKAKTQTQAQTPSDPWREVVAQDNLPPTGLTANIGSDPAVFDGQKFMAISSSDNQSGVDYYEVKEGNLPLVRSGHTYVLRDQSGRSDILVVAYDKAGNSQRILIKPVNHRPVIVASALVIAIIILGLIIYLFVRRHKVGKRKHE